MFLHFFPPFMNRSCFSILRRYGVRSNLSYINFTSPQLPIKGKKRAMGRGEACLPRPRSIDSAGPGPVGQGNGSAFKESWHKPVLFSSIRYWDNPFEGLLTLISIPLDHGSPYIWKPRESIGPREQHPFWDIELESPGNIGWLAQNCLNRIRPSLCQG
jgi:hypothetical protein